jgi:hypothetical protein
MMTWHDDAMRTIIDLPADQLDALDGICRRESISRAEASSTCSSAASPSSA